MSKQNQNISEDNDSQKHYSEWIHCQDVVTILASRRDSTVILPAGYPLRRSSFTRRGEHLIVKAPRSPEVVVARFFGDGGQTNLLTENGDELSRHMVMLMSSLSTRVEKALSALAAPSGD